MDEDADDAVLAAAASALERGWHSCLDAAAAAAMADLPADLGPFFDDMQDDVMLDDKSSMQMQGDMLDDDSEEDEQTGAFLDGLDERTLAAAEAAAQDTAASAASTTTTSPAAPAAAPHPSPHHSVHWVYVLQLEHECWYVGSTGNLDKRLAEHFAGGAQAAAWVQQHPAVEIFGRPLKMASKQDALAEETRRTAQLMLEHGANLVRGGSWSRCSMLTSEADLPQLVSDIAHHLGLSFANVRDQLKAKLDRMPLETPLQARSSPSAADNLKDAAPTASDDCCTRCGRNSHSRAKCIANTHLDGHRLTLSPPPPSAAGQDSASAASDSLPCSRCGYASHSRAECRAQTHRDGRRLGQPSRDPACFRCGHRSHFEAECVAIRHISGGFLSPPPARLRAAGAARAASNRWCRRCGRITHSEEDCYATKSIANKPLGGVSRHYPWY